MLTLTRNPGERIMIGDDIVIQISRISRRSVAVDIFAPRDIPVHREEIYNRIKAEQAAAGESDGGSKGGSL